MASVVTFLGGGKSLAYEQFGRLFSYLDRQGLPAMGALNWATIDGSRSSVRTMSATAEEGMES
jgi:hypothetical protein